MENEAFMDDFFAQVVQLCLFLKVFERKNISCLLICVCLCVSVSD